MPLLIEGFLEPFLGLHICLLALVHHPQVRAQEWTWTPIKEVAFKQPREEKQHALLLFFDFECGGDGG